ncbi:hypothetical protein PZA11_001117 [Diplocarpon coronariae]
MEASQLHARPPSAAVSSITSRPSFQSRHKNPLSVISSRDYASSRRSQKSMYLGPNTSTGIRHGFLAIRPAMSPSATPGKWIPPQSMPDSARNGAGGHGRKQKNIPLPPRRTGLLRADMMAAGQAFTVRGEGFKKLPEEILLAVLAELKRLHLGSGSLSCSTCWMRDLNNLALSCKKWWRAARSVLYEDIQLIGCDSIIHTKKFKLKFGTRLRLLRRTLRTRPELASYVKSLKVPATPDVAKSKKEQDEYLELVASLIMTCPNLERLPGFHPVYNHEFTKFIHALSTRRRLTEKVWVISASPFQRQHRYNISTDSEFLTPILAPSPLLPEQCDDFLIYHANWAHLKSLFLHCNAGGTIDSPLFTAIFHSLPTLENLLVSSFPAISFNDETLLLLPSLKSLRLDNLPGVTADGLSNYGAPARTDSLTSLSLISLPILSLAVLARLFSRLKTLTHFTLSQGPSPSLPIDTKIYLHPYLASTSLQYLHWEFTKPDDYQATDILSKSLACGGFPSLRTLRAPTDHDGTLQRLCKPCERIELPADRYHNMKPTRSSYSQSAPNPSPTHSPTQSLFSSRSSSNSHSSAHLKSPTQSAFSLNMSTPAFSHCSSDREIGMSLAMSRRMAQHRIDTAAQTPKLQVSVWAADGQFAERFAVGYCGSVKSRVLYSLKPDVEGSDEAVVAVQVWLERGENGRDGCTGSWNSEAGEGKGKRKRRGKDAWWHTERARWNGVGLERFFWDGKEPG